MSVDMRKVLEVSSVPLEGVLSIHSFWGSGIAPDGGTFWTEYEFNGANGRLVINGGEIHVTGIGSNVTAHGALPPPGQPSRVDVTLRLATGHLRLRDVTLTIRGEMMVAAGTIIPEAA